MPFGYATAPDSFMSLMTIVFFQNLYNTCDAYLNDIIFCEKCFKEILQRQNKALDCLDRANFKLKTSKCSFEKRSVSFFGNIIRNKGIRTYPEKLCRIQV